MNECEIKWKNECGEIRHGSDVWNSNWMNDHENKSWKSERLKNECEIKAGWN